MKTSVTIGKISVALLAAQKQMGAAAKDVQNPFFKKKYADYGSVLEVCKEPLNNNGITVLQSVHSDTNGHYIETILVHESGEFIGAPPLALELTKEDMQSLGSAITYARRYQLQSLLSIPSEDDDANTATFFDPGNKKEDGGFKSVSKIESKKPETQKTGSDPFGF